MISTKKQIAIALFALVLSFLAIALAQNAHDAADTANTTATHNNNLSTADLNTKLNKSGDTATDSINTIRTAAGDLVTYHKAVSSGGGSTFWIEAGNGVTSSEYAYVLLRSNESSPQRWDIGMRGDKYLRFYNVNTGHTPIYINGDKVSMAYVPNATGTTNAPYALCLNPADNSIQYNSTGRCS